MEITRAENRKQIVYELVLKSKEKNFQFCQRQCLYYNEIAHAGMLVIRLMSQNT